MLPMGSSMEGSVEYSFAMEYHGPPLDFDIPRALPVNVERIPVASVVSSNLFPDRVSLPVVQPLEAPNNRSKKFSAELTKLGSDRNVSPTSVMDFEREIDGSNYGLKEVELASEATLSPHSLVASEERAKSGSPTGDLCSSGVLDSSSGCQGFVESSGVLDSSSELGCSSISLEHSQELLGGSSHTVDYCESFAKSRDLSSRSEELRVSSSIRGNLEFDDLNHPSWASTKSLLSTDYPSSAVSSFRTGECDGMPSADVRRAPLVTFRDIGSNVGGDHESTSGEALTEGVKKEAMNKSRKGACYRCLKGSRFTEKEVCTVCNAKYCSNCVLRAMGSMPEGRKCVTCIGYPIDESKRGNLGKCSRILKRLLNDLEIRQIMKAEKFCDINQMPPEYICVNGRHLCHDELVLLQSCCNPPKNLKPGQYWYDRVSGLWGKEGQKPSQIISPHLNVGDEIKPNASNGNTQVFINGREITKVELRMLQLAGVQCAGNPHFWVNEDGSYQEEGQKNTKGYIWGKAGTKMVCALLSLPVPSKYRHPYGEEVNHVASRVFPDYFEERLLQKLLLVGCSGSGTSTIFKQAKILYKEVPFSEDERENIKLTIQSNVYGYLGILLEGRERFEEEILLGLRRKQSSDGDVQVPSTYAEDSRTLYSISPRLKPFCDWLLKAMALGDLETIFPAATREYAPVIEELWNSAAIQATYSRRNELDMLPGVASYFLERVVDVLRVDYVPSDLDILYAEGVVSSNGLACVDFSFPQSSNDEDLDADQNDCLLRYQLIRMQARGLIQNCKWLQMLDDARLVIFCVDLSDYDQFCTDEKEASTNKMLLSRKLFESLVTHPTLEEMDFLLILNKFDLLEKKIEEVPLSQCEWFEDFHPLVSRNHSSNSKTINNTSIGQLAFHYIAQKFKKLYSQLTGRKLYVSLVKGLEPDSVDGALKYAREILKWEDERINFSSTDYSLYGAESCSLSH